MADIYGTDLKLFNGDLVVDADGGLELVTGIDNLNQSLLNAFLTPYYFWGGSYKHGSRLQEFVEGSSGSIDSVDLKRAVAEVLRADERVIKDSWEIQLQVVGDETRITATYIPVGRLTPEILNFLLE